MNVSRKLSRKSSWLELTLFNRVSAGIHAMWLEDSKAVEVTAQLGPVSGQAVMRYHNHAISGGTGGHNEEQTVTAEINVRRDKVSENVR